MGVVAADPAAEPMTWRHSVKGLITGYLRWEDDTWARIELVGDHTLWYGSESNRGRIDQAGSTLTVRKSRLKQIRPAERR